MKPVAAIFNLLGYVVALGAGAFLIDLTTPDRAIAARVAFWIWWCAALALLMWAGGSIPSRRPAVALASNRSTRASRSSQFIRLGLALAVTAVNLITT